MGEAHFEEIVAFVGFDDADRAMLRALHPHVRPHTRNIADAFYRQIKQSKAAAVFRDDRQIERLKLSLQGWVNQILEGPWDEKFVELQIRIGRVHVQVGLPQRFMLTAMSVVRQELEAIVRAAYGDDNERCYATNHAVAKLLDMVLALMLGSYREDSISALRRLEEVERKLIAQELEVSEERCKAVLETAEVMTIAIAPAGDVRMFNRQAELISGYHRTEILTADDLSLIWHPAEAAAARDALEDVRGGRVSLVAELRIVSRAGETRWIRWHITHLPSSTGDGEVCFIGVDLTAERQFAERTRRAETLATIGTLAAGLAHEIRNPLNAAQLQLTLAERRLNREGASSEITRAPIKVVREELGRLATLVEDFLAYARPSPLRVAAVDLRAVAIKVVELLEPTAIEAGIVLELSRGSSVTAEVDEERIRQILINLVRNAIDATRASGAGGAVRIGVERVGPSALIEVRDSGPGVSRELDIFEPFATSKDTGTGLGLSIVERIVTDHRGTIDVRRDGDETVFRVELPTSVSSQTMPREAWTPP